MDFTMDDMLEVVNCLDDSATITLYTQAVLDESLNFERTAQLHLLLFLSVYHKFRVRRIKEVIGEKYLESEEFSVYMRILKKAKNEISRDLANEQILPTRLISNFYSEHGDYI